MTLLKDLHRLEKEISMLEHAANMLYWDQSTIMPKQAAEQRADVMAYLAKLIHEKITSSQYKKLITTLHKKRKLSKIDKLIVSSRFEDLEYNKKLPLDFIEECTRASAISHEAWIKARKEKNYDVFEPHLRKQVQLKQKWAEYVGESVYDDCLDEYEERVTAKQVDELFGELTDGLRILLDQIKQSKFYRNPVDGQLVPYDLRDILKGESFSIEKQKIIAKDILQRMGIDFNRSTMADTIHPFMCTISYDDKRVGMAYREKNLMFGITSATHEGGHALYEFGMDKKYADTCLNGAPSMGLHESQSRFWENQIGLSKQFWQFYLPKLKKHFDIMDVFRSSGSFYRAINRVKPSLIRIEADEVTYCLHIIIRYELERDLLDGKITTKELPELWNKKYKQYLGITPSSVAKGVLQDMHWSEGCFGYFPTYALGNIYSGMFYEKMLKDIPDAMQNVKKGNLNVVREWQRKNIHRHASTMYAWDLIKKVCKKPVTTKPYLHYLKEKYGELYR